MNTEEMVEMFEKHNDEFLKFERITNPPHQRPDMSAFMMLHELSPRSRDMICGAEHDEIYLDADLESVADKITEAQIIDLVRCGVRIDNDGFCMFA